MKHALRKNIFSVGSRLIPREAGSGSEVRVGSCLREPARGAEFLQVQLSDVSISQRCTQLRPFQQPQVEHRGARKRLASQPEAKCAHDTALPAPAPAVKRQVCWNDPLGALGATPSFAQPRQQCFRLLNCAGVIAGARVPDFPSRLSA